MVNDDGEDNLKCVGENRYGGLGAGPTNDPVKTPVPSMIGLKAKIAKMKMGFLHSCVITSEEVAYCSGRNHKGQLGNDSTTDTSLPVAVVLEGSTKIYDVSVGDAHTCLVSKARNILCMGHNEFGQLGLANNVDQNKAALVTLAGTAVIVNQLSCGYAHTCIVNDLYKVLCTGYNRWGQLGVDDEVNRNQFTLISNPGNDASYAARKVAAARRHTCILLTNALVYCMGNGDSYYGLLGNGETVGSNVPVKVTIPEGVIPADIASGDHHSCISTNDVNVIYCWGIDWFGNLGNGSTIYKNIPTLVKGLDFPPTTVSPTTAAPTTASPTIVAPTTAAPTIAAPASVSTLFLHFELN